MFLTFMDDLITNWPTAWRIVLFIAALGVGVFFLVKFCDIFVDSASSIAKKAHISPMVIGLTIVAMGTSFPELAVSSSDSITALLESTAENQVHANIALANVVGSNICNILLVLGISIFFTPIIVKKETLKRDYPFLIFVTVLCVVFGLCFNLSGDYAILRFEGIIFVVLMIAYLVYLVIDSKKHPVLAEEDEIKDMALWKAIILLIVGGVGVFVGGEAVVFGAKGIALAGAASMGIDSNLAEKIIGLTVVAVGTSLPELVTSAIAAKKGQVELALGNVIGSNLFNILFVLGISSTINPIIADGTIVLDLIFMLTITILLFGISFTKKLDRKFGILFLGLYVAYVTYLVLRVILATQGINLP